MASLTIQHLEESTEARLRARAVMHGRSLEDEAREILENAVAEKKAEPEPLPGNLWDHMRARVEPFGGFQLPEMKREPPRDPPTFD